MKSELGSRKHRGSRTFFAFPLHVHQKPADRSFIENNIQWIIDYKTVFGDELDLEIEAKTHSEQLNLYESLFEDECSIQKAIYFVRQGKLILI